MPSSPIFDPPCRHEVYFLAMPLYDYQCTACNKITEVRHGFDEALAEPCPFCGGKLNRLFNPTGIVFKGSGFYITDSRKAAESKTSDKPESKTTKTDGAPSNKTETATASTPPPDKPSGKPSAA